MKNQLAKWALGVLALFLVSCDDPVKQTIVWGVMKVDASQDDKIVNGITLAQEGADSRGFCSYKDKKFSFGIGDTPPSTNFRFEISGIKGPPGENPYLADGKGTLRSDEARHFTKGQIWNQEGGWVFNNTNIIADKCLAVLFAESGPGDLTPKEYEKQPFQYVVKMVCHNGLDSIESLYDKAGPALTGFELELWFDNCDTD